jgi:predicted outer membrane repeat protein
MEKRTNLEILLLMSVFLTGLSCLVAKGQTIYVDAHTPDNNDGSSWVKAYKYLQDGLTDASSGDQIWVAEGTYRPDASNTDPTGSADRDATFMLVNGVDIYGGFASGDAWQDRDPNHKRCILSGDINTPGDTNDNSYHVVTISSVDSSTIIDGFTVIGGNANGTTSPKNCGGGIYSINSSPILVNCRITRNMAAIYGGGMQNEDGSPELRRCTFANNSAETGGGMYNDSWDDRFAGNLAVLTNCTFSGNTSIVAGGGVHNFYCDSILTDCVFEDNSTVPGASGGGGICNDRSLTTLTGCTFSGNSTSNGAGGGLYNREISDANVVDCVFTGNSAYYHGGGMYNRGKAMVVNCTFISNSGHFYSHSSGGGIADYYGDRLTLVNCVFSGNSAGFGGGMFNRRSDYINVVNCTFSGNSATYSGEGGGIYNRNCTPVISNCIIWGNIGDQIYNYDYLADPNVTYCCVQGSYPGIGNINSNPMFASSSLHLQDGSPCIDAGNNDVLPPDMLDVDDDSDSTELIPWDHASKLRRVDDPAVDPDPGYAGTIGVPIVDMGAYEVSPIFVDDNASSWGDGRSWTTAFKYLQDALFAAGDPMGGRGEIRVAQGTYYPDQSEWGHVIPTDREVSFELQNNLALRGGYRGLGCGGSPDDRDITAFETILSGDYVNDDNPNDPNSNDENCLHVVSAGYIEAASEVIDDTGVLHGFTIMAGNANGELPNDWGGGMFNIWSSPTVTRCTFRDNSATHGGGMMNFFLSNPTISNCLFSRNSADDGGGIFNDVSDPKLTNCTFNGNTANSRGGGIYNLGHPILINCTFNGNSANSSGGGIYNSPSSVPTLLTNCTFSGNTASLSGGGIYNNTGNSIITNSVFWNNSDSNGVSESSQIFTTDPNKQALLTYSCMKGCSTYCLDANDRNIGEDPLFLREPNDGGDGWGDDPCTPGIDESLNDDYGDLRLTAGSPCIDTGNNDADIDLSTPELDPLPDTDLDGRHRFADGDCNDTNIVDMGAYEFTSTYFGDFDVDCDIDFLDYAIFADFLFTDELLVDIAPTPAGDGIIDERDLNILCNNWLFGK